MLKYAKCEDVLIFLKLHLSLDLGVPYDWWILNILLYVWCP